MKTRDFFEKNNQLDNYIIFQNEYDKILNLPKTLPGNKYLFAFEQYQKQKSQAVFFAKLKNVKILGSNDGIDGASIITNENILLDDLFSYSGESYRNVNYKDCYKISNKCSFISQKWGGTNYFHWLITVMPKLCLLIKNNYLNEYPIIICNSFDEKYIQEAFMLLNIPIGNLISQKKYNSIFVNEVIVPSYIGFNVNANKLTADLLKDTFKNYIKLSCGKRLLLRRNGYRKLNNEAEVFSVLSRYGFQIVDNTNLSFKDQIQLFSEAEFVVGPHGANFSNIVFCNKKTKILEMFPDTYVSTCYWQLAEAAELDYYYYVSEGNTYNNTNGLWYSNGSKNIDVDIQKLKELLSMMGL